MAKREATVDEIIQQLRDIQREVDTLWNDTAWRCQKTREKLNSLEEIIKKLNA